jgi:hypothetical protein
MSEIKIRCECGRILRTDRDEQEGPTLEALTSELCHFCRARFIGLAWTLLYITKYGNRNDIRESAQKFFQL